MSNMSYCRFRNTLIDLRDCKNHVDEPLDNKDEWKARQELVKVCKKMVEDYEDFVDFDGDEFEGG